ncbi:SCO family protein [Marinomonas ostreistagni]|uniref:SCO family protein n=1 Tax=Marinomonas ostreistagni TaxID=359209 RepID=A0ABS0ZAT2_9GAMM|nr:SCO family protein [Marinomonas ostreistagni]MBJ7550071.1 SCO family protein [Marinomonas ostreistagni]
MFKKTPLWLRTLIVSGVVLSAFPLAIIASSYANQGYGLSINRDDSLNFSWLDTKGFSHSFNEIDADAVYLMFGFFSCSDICPVRVHQLQQLSEKLDQENALRDVKFLMVTIDPFNEPAELRERYFNALSNRFVSAELSPEILKQVQSELGERVRYLNGSPSHAGYLYLFNHEKKLMKVYSQLSYPKGALYSDLITIEQSSQERL